MPDVNRQRQFGASALILLGTAGVVGLGMWVGRTVTMSQNQTLIGWAFASFCFGALVGLSEILSRYRDEPILATATAAGFSYLALNGIISISAFVVMRHYSSQIFPAIQQDLFLTAVVAGFGGMVVFRSKLFTFKSSDGNEYPIGPAIVLDTVLKTIDSKIDRRRATERQTKVFGSMSQINDFARTADYMEASLSSFQNLSQADKTQISSIITQYRTTTKWPDALKSLGLGFAFLTIAGETNFDVVIENLKLYVQGQNAIPTPPPQTPPTPPPATPPTPPQATPPTPPPQTPPTPPPATLNPASAAPGPELDQGISQEPEPPKED